MVRDAGQFLEARDARRGGGGGSFEGEDAGRGGGSEINFA